MEKEKNRIKKGRRVYVVTKLRAGRGEKCRAGVMVRKKGKCWSPNRVSSRWGGEDGDGGAIISEGDER